MFRTYPWYVPEETVTLERYSPIEAFTSSQSLFPMFWNRGRPAESFGPLSTVTVSP